MHGACQTNFTDHKLTDNNSGFSRTRNTAVAAIGVWQLHYQIFFTDRVLTERHGFRPK